MTDRSVTYEFRAKFDSFRASLAAGGKSVDDFGKKLTGLDAQGAKARQGLSHFGDIGGKIALGATAGLAAIGGVTANFEKAMSGVAAATGEGEAGMNALREAAIQAGADTAFSASEAAAGIENLAKAGVSTQDILGGGLQGALDLAAAGQIDVAVAAEAAASAMTQFGLAGADVPHIADLLAAAAGKAQGEVTDFAAALNQSGLIAAQVGLSIEETAGGLAAFASAGLLGSDAGTSFKTMLGALTPNSAKAKTAMEELGISAYDAQGNFIGLSEFAGNLQAGLSGLTDQQRQATLETIFGSDAVRAASILYEQGAGGIQEWIDKTNDSGFAAEQAATKLDNLAGDFEALKGSLETALIGAGEGSQGPLRSLVQGLTGAVNAFNDLPGPAKGATTALLGVTAILGSGIWVASKVVTGIANTKQALSDLGIEANRTKGIMGGLAKIGAGVAVFEAVTFAIDQLHARLEKPINTATLSRDIESLADGRVTSNLEDMSIWLTDIQRKSERDFNPIAQLSPLDMSGFEDAERGLADLDEGLAALVEGGQIDQAAAAYSELSAQAKEAGLSQSDLNNRFVEYDTALRNAGENPPGAWLHRAGLGAMFAAEGAEDAAGATSDLGDAAAEASPKQQRLAEALKESRSAARATARQFFGLGDSLDNAKVSLAGWLRDLEKQASALRDFRVNAQQAAKRGLDDGLIASLHEAGPAGAMRMRQLANATDAEIKRANRAWRSGQAEVNKYTNAVGGVPERASTDVNVNGIPTALTSIGRLRADLNSIPPATHTYVYTHFRKTGSGQGQSHSPNTGADGATVPKTGLPYADRHLYLLADGEEVISNRRGQADRFRADRAAGRIPGYAEGGTAGRTVAVPASSHSGSRSTVVVRDRFPDKVTLRVGGREFTAYVEGIATDVADRTLEGAELMWAEEERAG